MLLKDEIHNLLSGLTAGNNRISEIYPGDNNNRQPIHTLYGGAQLFNAGTMRKMNELALNSFTQNVKNGSHLSEIFGWTEEGNQNNEIFNKVYEKLKREAVEDFRIDFEDGLGIVSESEEVDIAEFTAKEYHKSIKDNISSPFFGIRIKSFSEETKYRAVKTLNVFLNTFIRLHDGIIPENFVITLPKVTSADQVSVFAATLERIEKHFNLSERTLKFEIMVETPQAVFDQQGNVNLLNLINSSDKRCISVHIGLYDMTSYLNISPVYQSYEKPLCDFIRSIMKFTLSGTGINISDGATIIIPAVLHKGSTLSKEQIHENRKSVFGAWKIIHDNVFHSLKNGIYQGWDLHPAQIPARYATVYKFFLEGYKEVSRRLLNFIDKAAKATLTGVVFDDAATGQGMLNFLLRAYRCGAIDETDVNNAGLTINQLKSKSFLKIVSDKSN